MVIALGAAWFAWRAAKANEQMAVEQKEANRLHAEELAMTRQHRQEDRDDEAAAAAAATDARAAEARAEASRIRVQYESNAGIDVIIRNDSRRPVDDLRLITVSSTDHPAWTHVKNPAIMFAKDHTPRLLAGDDHVVPVLLVDENGTQKCFAGQRYGSLVRFTYRDGTRWEIGDSAGPRQVSGDDSDLPALASS